MASLVSYFAVPKGDSDVRVVFDGTKSGLSKALWAPSFCLPTVDSVTPMLEPGSWQADIDVGEMFYNFMLDPQVRPFCGVDATPYMTEGPGSQSWLLWSRCVMGLKSSPHGCVLMQSLGEERFRGNPEDPANPFYFDEVRLNLPGDANYDPRRPKVCKYNTETGRIAGDVGTYVDNLRPVGSSRMHCSAVAHRISTVMCFLGIQDALRKRSAPSRRAGAWSSSVIHTDQGQLTVSVTQEKWDRARSYLLEMQQTLASSGEFDFKELEKQRGFLVYVTRTYPALVPFLKGIHLTLDSWRGNRDAEGWKLMGELAAHHGTTVLAYDKHPAKVRAVPRLTDDVASLLALFSSERPPRRVLRSTQVLAVFYGYGDASGCGFGSTFTAPGGLEYSYGLWGDDLAGLSSNYRELFNLTEALAAKVETLPFQHLDSVVGALEKQVTLQASSEIFMFTDNAVAEGAFFRGTSSNRRLFELIVRLKQLELHKGVQLHVIHVSGSRMQAQGTDALSRGDLNTGVMRNLNMLAYVPLHLGATVLSPAVVNWVHSWAPPGKEVSELTPAQWYTVGHGHMGSGQVVAGMWAPNTAPASQVLRLWAPPPAAADVAIEQLSFSRHKRPDLTHVFVCPRLMTHRWRKRLYKISDVLFNVPTGACCSALFWPAHMYEPLVIGLILPFLPTSPWLRRDTPSVLDLAGALRGVWSQSPGADRDILRQFWL